MAISILNIAICTHNRAKDLSRCLKSIISDSADFPYKIRIVVVDNNSSDKTPEIINTYKIAAASANIEFISIFEPQTGKINALRHIFERCIEGYTLFLDDDNELPSGTLKTVAQLISQNDTTIYGSTNIPILRNQPPEWFSFFENAYACGNQVDLNKLTYAVWGAGMLCPAKYFKVLRSKEFAFSAPGRKGKKLTSGSDSEISMIMQVCGASVSFPENYRLNHHIDEKRLNLKYLYRLAFNFGKTDTLTDPYKRFIKGEIDLPFPSRLQVIKTHWGYFRYNLKDLKPNLLSIKRTLFGFFYNLGYIVQTISHYDRLVANQEKIRKFCSVCSKQSL